MLHSSGAATFHWQVFITRDTRLLLCYSNATEMLMLKLVRFFRLKGIKIKFAFVLEPVCCKSHPWETSRKLMLITYLIYIILVRYNMLYTCNCYFRNSLIY